MTTKIFAEFWFRMEKRKGLLRGVSFKNEFCLEVKSDKQTNNPRSIFHAKDTRPHLPCFHFFLNFIFLKIAKSTIFRLFRHISTPEAPSLKTLFFAKAPSPSPLPLTTIRHSDPSASSLTYVHVHALT